MRLRHKIPWQLSKGISAPKLGLKRDLKRRTRRMMRRLRKENPEEAPRKNFYKCYS